MKLQKYKRDSEVSYALGATLVAELLKTHPNAITRVFLRPADKYGDDLTKILDELKARKFEIIESTKAFNILGAKDNCLLAAEFRKECLYEPQGDILRTPGQKDIILVNPSDSGNLGTIMRSAAAFGFNEITIVPPAVDPYDPKVIRASMGAIFHLNLTEMSEDEFLNLNFNFVSAHIKGTPYRQFVKRDNMALILGNEGSGISKNILERSEKITIPIHNVESLNVNAAAAVLIMHFT